MPVRELISGTSDTQYVTLRHGEDLTGRNPYEVAKTALCPRRCRWCDALVHRCQSRGGKVT